MKNLLYIILLCFCFGNLNVIAQDNQTEVDSLCQQLFKSSNRYTENDITYRVIKSAKLQSLSSEIKDIDVQKSAQIISSANVNDSLQASIDHQAEEYAALSDKYDYAIKANDSMEFFTLLIPKARYNLILWSIVIALVVLLLILFVIYKRALVLTKSAQAELSEAKEEFEAYRQRTLKREQEVASSYVREINKLKGAR